MDSVISEPHKVVTPEQVAEERTTKPVVGIENWRIVSSQAALWVANEKDYYVHEDNATGNVILGEVYGHPRFADGKPVATSRIVNAPECDRDELETYNTRYILGAVDPQYAVWMDKLVAQTDGRERDAAL